MTIKQDGQWIKPPGAQKAAWYTDREARELRDMVAGAAPEQAKAVREEALLLHAIKAEFSADLLAPGDLGGMDPELVAEGDAEMAARRTT